MQTSLPFRRKWKTARRGAAEARMRPRSWRPTPSATSTRGPRWPVRHAGSAMPRRGAWGWRWRGVPPPSPPKSPTHCPEATSRPVQQGTGSERLLPPAPPFRSGGLRGQGDLAPGGCTTVWVPQSCWGPASDGRMRSSVRAPHTQAGTEPSAWLPSLSPQVRECVRARRSVRRLARDSDSLPSWPGHSPGSRGRQAAPRGLPVCPPRRLNHRDIKLPKVKLTDKKYFN